MTTYFRRDQKRAPAETMELLKQLYGSDKAKEYAQDAMNDAREQAAKDDREDATDLG